jgi:hypothetical protein
MRARFEAAAARAGRERGSALVWSLLFVIVVAGMIISHATFMAANRRDADVRFRQKPLSETFARSGLTDALAWFRKQPTQPVTAFDPKLDPTGDPPVLETIDPTVGLVREFEIRGKLWGRYEVRRGEVLDITQQRGLTQAGSVWEVGGRGILYEVVDPSRAFNVAPNRIVSVTSLKSELRGVPLLLPQSAVSIPDERNVVLDNGSKLVGGNKPAIVFRDRAPAGYVAPPDPDHDPADDSLPIADVTGTPTTLRVATYNNAAVSVFGMRLDELRSLADQIVPGDTVFKRPFRDGSIVFVEGNIVVPPGAPLRGRVLLIVDGNVFFALDNDSDFEGLVYVTGAFVMKGKARFRGVVVANTLFKIYADAEVIYDECKVQTLQAEVARYRLSRSLLESGVGDDG